MPEATRSTVKDRLPGTRRSRGVGLAMAALALTGGLVGLWVRSKEAASGHV